MKAIHNGYVVQQLNVKVGNYKLKYNFESNSQQTPTLTDAQLVGNYKLKYNFESNSQQIYSSHNAKALVKFNSFT